MTCRSQLKSRGSAISVLLLPANKNEYAFSLAEVLVAVVILAVATVSSLAAFNVATKSIYGTALRSNANAAIDSDIARIKQMAEAYNACADPKGSLGSCPGQTLGTSFYYSPTTSANYNTFFTACKSTSDSTHITNNLIVEINKLSQIVLNNNNVERSPATRESSGVPSSHLIRIIYTGTSSTNIERIAKILPVLSAWCP